MDKHWKTLSIKDKCCLILAFSSFFLGWLLLILSFYTEPIGTIDSSVLATYGSSLVFCASCLGIELYYSSQLEKFKDGIRQELRDIKSS